MRPIYCIFLITLFSVNVLADTVVAKLLMKTDKLYRSKGSEGQIEMEVITPDWSRIVEMDVWTRGIDFTFIRIKSPRKDKGVSSLKREKSVWNFFPKINKVIKIPPSMMMSSWMGSDFTNDDLVKNSSLIQDYQIKSHWEKNGKIEIILTPKQGTISLWGKVTLSIDKKSELPLRQDFFDESNKKIRTLYFKDVKKFGSKVIPSVLELHPLTKKGHKTIIRYKSINFDKKVPLSIFTLTNLQKRR